MKEPKALKCGDTIGLIAPSSPTQNPENVELSVKKLVEMGFKVKVAESCYGNYGYLAGRDDIRARDINLMFADKDVAGILCLRGGYGTPRILDKLDYDVIKKNPKAFIGYSDITAIHIALNQKCKLVTFHGPMATSDMIDDFDDFTKESFIRAITLKEPLKELNNPEGIEIKCLTPGKASGSITGGNLSLIVSTLGTKYEIDTKGKLLLIEEIDEEPYRVDRMLTQLRLAGKFDDCSGLIIGDWNNCVPKNSRPSLTLMELFEDIILPSKKPAIYNFMTGHCKPKITVPLGVEAELDATACTLTLKESAVI
jgi:muramoyltetrapeptide carboxypeptidase